MLRLLLRHVKIPIDLSQNGIDKASTAVVPQDDWEAGNIQKDLRRQEQCGALRSVVRRRESPAPSTE